MADSFIRVPPDGAGKRLNTSEDTVNAEVVQTQRMQVVSGDNVLNLASVDVQGAISTRFTEGTPTLDAFGRLMISQLTPKFLEHFVDRYDTSRLTETTVGGGAVARVAQTSSLNLSVGTASGDIAKVESNTIIKYSPGIGVSTAFTLWMGDTGKTNSHRRWGLFDDDNGVFFDLDGTTLSFVVRSSATGSIVDTHYAQGTWSDPLDGTGLSGVTLDITNLNIFWFDYQWLGAGAVRFGVHDPKGNRIVAGTVENANSIPRPFMQTGSNRFRAELVNDAVTGSTTEMSLVCIAVRADGQTDRGRSVYGDIQTDGLAVTGSNVYLAAARPKATHLGKTNVAVAVPNWLEVYTDQPIRLDILLGGATTAPTWGISSVGPLEMDIGGSAYVGGRVLRSELLEAGVTNLDFSRFEEYQLNAINLWPGGVQPEFAFVAHQLGGAAATSVSLSLLYEELL